MEHSFIKTRKTWACKSCKKRFTVKIGTIMEDSPLKIETWFAAMWMLGNSKNGISSCEVARALGVTQKTAWSLLHRIREAMKTGSFEKIGDPVEVDECFVGGLEGNKHKSKKLRIGRGSAGKNIVMGILDRGEQRGESKVRLKIIEKTDRATVQGEIRRNVHLGSEVFTDAMSGYRGLAPEYRHQWVDHAVEYAQGNVHTNGMENFWSLFQRMFGGTYPHMDPQHLAAYFDEMAHNSTTAS